MEEKMIKVEISPKDLARINDLKANHPVDNIRVRMLVLWLKHLKTKHGDICRIAKISRPTLANYLKLFSSGGVDALLKWNLKGQPSQLDAHSQQIVADFDLRPPSSLAEAGDRIEEITGLKRSIPQVSKYLSRISFRRIKAGSAPGKIDPDRQDEFKKNF